MVFFSFRLGSGLCPKHTSQADCSQATRMKEEHLAATLSGNKGILEGLWSFYGLLHKNSNTLIGLEMKLTSRVQVYMCI